MPITKKTINYISYKEHPRLPEQSDLYTDMVKFMASGEVLISYANGDSVQKYTKIKADNDTKFRVIYNYYSSPSKSNDTITFNFPTLKRDGNSKIYENSKANKDTLTKYIRMLGNIIKGKSGKNIQDIIRNSLVYSTNESDIVSLFNRRINDIKNSTTNEAFDNIANSIKELHDKIKANLDFNIGNSIRFDLPKNDKISDNNVVESIEVTNENITKINNDSDNALIPNIIRKKQRLVNVCIITTDNDFLSQVVSLNNRYKKDIARYNNTIQNNGAKTEVRNQRSQIVPSTKPHIQVDEPYLKSLGFINCICNGVSIKSLTESNNTYKITINLIEYTNDLPRNSNDLLTQKITIGETPDTTTGSQFVQDITNDIEKYAAPSDRGEASLGLRHSDLNSINNSLNVIFGKEKNVGYKGLDTITDYYNTVLSISSVDADLYLQLTRDVVRYLQIKDPELEIRKDFKKYFDYGISTLNIENIDTINPSIDIPIPSEMKFEKFIDDYEIKVDITDIDNIRKIYNRNISVFYMYTSPYLIDMREGLSVYADEIITGIRPKSTQIETSVPEIRFATPENLINIAMSLSLNTSTQQENNNTDNNNKGITLKQYDLDLFKTHIKTIVKLLESFKIDVSSSSDEDIEKVNKVIEYAVNYTGSKEDKDDLEKTVTNYLIPLLIKDGFLTKLMNGVKDRKHINHLLSNNIHSSYYKLFNLIKSGDLLTKIIDSYRFILAIGSENLLKQYNDELTKTVPSRQNLKLDDFINQEQARYKFKINNIIYNCKILPHLNIFKNISLYFKSNTSKNVTFVNYYNISDNIVDMVYYYEEDSPSHVCEIKISDPDYIIRNITDGDSSSSNRNSKIIRQENKISIQCSSRLYNSMDNTILNGYIQTVTYDNDYIIVGCSSYSRDLNNNISKDYTNISYNTLTDLIHKAADYSGVRSIRKANLSDTYIDSVDDDVYDAGFFTRLSKFFSSLFENPATKIKEQNDLLSALINDKFIDDNINIRSYEHLDDLKWIIDINDTMFDLIKNANLLQPDKDVYIDNFGLQNTLTISGNNDFFIPSEYVIDKEGKGINIRKEIDKLKNIRKQYYTSVSNYLNTNDEDKRSTISDNIKEYHDQAQKMRLSHRTRTHYISDVDISKMRIKTEQLPTKVRIKYIYGLDADDIRDDRYTVDDFELALTGQGVTSPLEHNVVINNYSTVSEGGFLDDYSLHGKTNFRNSVIKKVVRHYYNGAVSVTLNTDIRVGDWLDIYSTRYKTLGRFRCKYVKHDVISGLTTCGLQMHTNVSYNYLYEGTTWYNSISSILDNILLTVAVTLAGIFVLPQVLVALGITGTAATVLSFIIGTSVRGGVIRSILELATSFSVRAIADNASNTDLNTIRRNFINDQILTYPVIINGAELSPNILKYEEIVK